MTLLQIAHVIDRLGNYDMDTWIPISEIPMINLGQDANVYVDPTTMRFKFNSTTENMEIVYGKIIDNIFTSNSGLTSDFISDSFVPFSAISSIVTSVTPGSQGTYYKKYFGNFA